MTRVRSQFAAAMMSEGPAGFWSHLPKIWANSRGFVQLANKGWIVMTELLSVSEMRSVERAAIDRGEVTGLELMERAGQGVVAAILAEWPAFAAAPHRATVLCGPGNNGGDGFVIARLLRQRNWIVEVFFLGEADRLPPDARANFDRWQELGEVRSLPPVGKDHDPWACDVIVDALFGTGLTRPVRLSGFSLESMLPEWDLRDEPGRPRIVAVDVPTGLCADSGRLLADGESLWADLTVTFHARKLGQYLAQGPFLCGRIVVADIGLKGETGADRSERALDRMFPLLALPPDSFAGLPVRLASVSRRISKTDPFGRETHKYSHGHALVLAGGQGRGGAARLAARGALRIGAGLVTLGCPAGALSENASRLDAVMVRELADDDAFGAFLADRRITGLCLGPGLGEGQRETELLAAALRAERATVLDADALSLLAAHPALFAALHPRTVLTPHAGEFARLFPDIAERLGAPATRGPAYSKVDAARDAAARAGCTVLFKGPDTVIADPSGRAVVNSAHYDRAAPWLATAGSGDVLAGFVSGLLARGLDPVEAAESAARLHLDCAIAFGPGLIAEDLPDLLPAALLAQGF